MNRDERQATHPQASDLQQIAPGGKIGTERGLVDRSVGSVRHERSPEYAAQMLTRIILRIPFRSFHRAILALTEVLTRSLRRHDLLQHHVFHSAFTGATVYRLWQLAKPGAIIEAKTRVRRFN